MILAVPGASAGLTLYTFSAGLVAAFNPCGFPILPAYLTLASADATAAPLAVRILRGLGSGIAVTFGFVLVFGALGAGAEAGIRSLQEFGWLPWVMAPVGLLCVAIGLWTIAGRTLPLHTPTRRFFSGRRRSVALVGFGITYAVASLGCSLPIFMDAVVGDFVRNGLLTGLIGGLSYALGMGLVITAVSLAGVGAQQLRLRRLRAAQPILQRLAGGLLVLIGGYLVLYWLTDALSPSTTPAPVAFVTSIQNTLQDWLAASPRVAGALIAVIVLACLGGACIHLLRSEPARDTAGKP